MKNKTILTSLLFIALAATNCTKNTDKNIDVAAPSITVISPEIDQTFTTSWGGAWPEGEPVTLAAKGTDDMQVSSISITVTNTNGDIVFIKTTDNTSTNELEFTINESYTAEDQDTYTVVFKALDASGNTATSTPRTFIYK